MFQVKAHQTLYNTLTFSELLLPFVSIGYPDATQSIPLSPLFTGRSHAHGDLRMVVINSRSLVYTQVHPLPSSDHYRIPQGTCIDSTQNPVATIRFCRHVPETLKENIPITRKKNVKYKANNLINYRY